MGSTSFLDMYFFTHFSSSFFCVFFSNFKIYGVHQLFKLSHSFFKGPPSHLMQVPVPMHHVSISDYDVHFYCFLLQRRKISWFISVLFLSCSFVKEMLTLNYFFLNFQTDVGRGSHGFHGRTSNEVIPPTPAIAGAPPKFNIGLRTGWQ